MTQQCASAAKFREAAPFFWAARRPCQSTACRCLGSSTQTQQGGVLDGDLLPLFGSLQLCQSKMRYYPHWHLSPLPKMAHRDQSWR
jgi:hypothetical protein